MKVDLRDIVRYELIGLESEVIGSKNKSNLGIKGKIVDETKNTISIEQKNKIKKLLKSNIILKIKIGDQEIKIPGERLSGRPKERIKNE